MRRASGVVGKLRERVEHLIQVYSEVQLDSTPEMEVLYMMFDRCHTKDRKRSLKRHTKYFNFRFKNSVGTPCTILLFLGSLCTRLISLENVLEGSDIAQNFA